MAAGKVTQDAAKPAAEQYSQLPSARHVQSERCYLNRAATTHCPEWLEIGVRLLTMPSAAGQQRGPPGSPAVQYSTAW